MRRRHARRKVAVGDLITVASGTPGQPARAAVIVEVQNGNGTPPYVVVWSDSGQRALLYPPGDAQIQRLAG